MIIQGDNLEALKALLPYFKKLKEIYRQQGVWEEQQEPLWQELSKVLPVHEYASLLAQKSETAKLLEVVKRYNHMFWTMENCLSNTFLKKPMPCMKNA